MKKVREFITATFGGLVVGNSILNIVEGKANTATILGMAFAITIVVLTFIEKIKED